MLKMRKIYLFALIFFIIALIFGGVGAILPLPTASAGQGGISAAQLAGARAIFISTLFTTGIILGSAALYLMGLGQFKTAFKRSYYWICAGLGFEALAIFAIYVGIYLSMYAQQSNVVAIASIISESLYITAAWFVFKGLRQFAFLLRVHSQSLSYKVVLSLAVISSVAAVLLPSHAASQASWLLQALGIGAYAAYIFLALVVTIIPIQIRNVASKRYSNALLLFSTHWGLLFIAGAITLLDEFTTLVPPAVVASTVAAYILSVLMLFFAGISFNKISRKQAVAANRDSMIDIIVYVASLVSSPRDVDPILDPMRSITASHSVDHLTPADRQTLIDVYARLETYLIRSEPLQVFTKEGLSNLLREKFDPMLVGQIMGSVPG